MYGGLPVASEPLVRRAVAFFDGQNLFHAAKRAFGYPYPNYDVSKLAERVARKHGWALAEVRFYTGVPDVEDNPRWNAFWVAKLAHMGRLGVRVFSRPLRYRTRSIRLADGSVRAFLDGEEKGIDVRIAIDVIRLAHRSLFDVALIFSQDQDLSEVAQEIRQIAHEQARWIKIASAFPSSPVLSNRRGIEKTDWIRIDRTTYDSCLDLRDYRSKLGDESFG